MKTYNNIVATTKPLAIINSVEFFFSKGIDMRNVGVIAIASGQEYIQIKSLISFYGLQEILLLNHTAFYSYLCVRIALIRYRKANLVVGAGGTLFRMVLSRIIFNQAVLVDEGNSVFRKNNNQFLKYDRRPVKRKYFESLVGACYYKDDWNISIFSFAKIDSELGINNYRYHKGLVTKKKILDEVWVIGGNHSGVFKEQGYLKYIELIREKLKYENVRYIKHKLESEEDLKLIERRFRFKLSSFDNPLEVELLMREQVPKMIIGSYSSALIMLNQFFGESIFQIVSLKVPNALLKSNRRNEIVHTYNNLQKHGVRVESI